MASAAQFPTGEEIAGELLRKTRSVTVDTVYTVSCTICGLGAVDGIFYDDYGYASDARLAHARGHIEREQETDS